MTTTIKYKGVITKLSDNLFDSPKIYKRPPTKSNKFGSISLYYDGVYYFVEDIKVNTNKNNSKPYIIQGVFYSGKWRQETFYITEEFKNFLNKHYELQYSL